MWMINSRGSVEHLDAIPPKERHKWRPHRAKDPYRRFTAPTGDLWNVTRGTDLKKWLVPGKEVKPRCKQPKPGKPDRIKPPTSSRIYRMAA